ncbi:hypothetical protein DM02DRAFT_544867, partial [Periconia macrospinosa]
INALRMNSSSPSSNVSTPRASRSPTVSPQQTRSQSLVVGLGALHVGSPSPTPSTLNANRSPSASSRRRSGSRTAKVNHRVEDEEPPESLFYKEEVQTTLASAKAIVARLSGVLSSSSLYQDPESSIRSLRRQATELNAFSLQSSRTVGLVGDSGAGKSSLINSLLDCKDLARESNSGQACTCVVTEYKFHDREDFTIDVDYFTVEELKPSYEDLLTAYRDNVDSLADDRLPENRTEAQKKFDLALSTFRASFKERLEHTPTILTTMPFDSAIDTMVEWARQTLRSCSISGSPSGFQQSYQSVEECSARLSQLTSEVNIPGAGHQICPWPFVKKLTVHLKSVILSKGLIIADLPGLRDSNLARQSITERYMRDCHQIFAVAKIDRAITDQSVKDIFDLARSASLSNISIVCTRSDEVNATQARNDFPREKAKIDAILADIKAEESKIVTLEEELEEFNIEEGDELLSEEEIREENLKRREWKNAMQSKRNRQFELDQHLIGVRNDHVSRAIRKEYQNHSVNGELQIFCVSNTIYRTYRNMPVVQAEPRLRLSGVLALRRYCVGIVAQSRYQATRDFVNDAIPAFVASLQIWLRASSGSANAERKEETLRTLTSIQDELSKYDHSTYKAFCSNYGAHQTASKPYTCWNEEAMKGMVAEMMPKWNDFASNNDSALAQTQRSVRSSFTTAVDIALGKVHTNHSREMQSTFLPLVEILRKRQRLSVHGVEYAIDEFINTSLERLRTDALSSVRTAYIGKLMERTYHAANLDYGRGVDRRRKSLITARFGSRELLHEHLRELQTSYNSLVDELEKRIIDIVEEQVQVITNDLDVIRNNNVIEESERDPEFRARLEAEVRRVSEELEGLRVGVEGLGGEGMEVDED